MGLGIEFIHFANDSVSWPCVCDETSIDINSRRQGLGILLSCEGLGKGDAFQFLGEVTWKLHVQDSTRHHPLGLSIWLVLMREHRAG